MRQLTPRQIEYIKTALERGEQQLQIAKIVGTYAQLVCDVNKGKRYRDEGRTYPIYDYNRKGTQCDTSE